MIGPELQRRMDRVQLLRAAVVDDAQWFRLQGMTLSDMGLPNRTPLCVIANARTDYLARINNLERDELNALSRFALGIGPEPAGRLSGEAWAAFDAMLHAIVEVRHAA